MFIKKYETISALHTFGNKPEFWKDVDLQLSKAKAQLPKVSKIPTRTLRRIGRCSRLGLDTAIQTIEGYDSLINELYVSSGFSDMTQCYSFLKEMVQHPTGKLPPSNFVGASSNSMTSMLSQNIDSDNSEATHFSTGASFWSSIFRAFVSIQLNPNQSVLFGASEEYSEYYQTILNAFRPFKSSNREIYASDTIGTIPGESASFFIADSNPKDAILKVVALDCFFQADTDEITELFDSFLANNNIKANEISTLISGESGCIEDKMYYNKIEHQLNDSSTIRFKHCFGENSNTTGIALWLACWLQEFNELPAHFYKKKQNPQGKLQLIYNHFAGNYHQFLLLEPM